LYFVPQLIFKLQEYFVADIQAAGAVEQLVDTVLSYDMPDNHTVL
jgi:hypothetical protein